jgi:citrate lyase alpha subunit
VVVTVVEAADLDLIAEVNVLSVGETVSSEAAADHAMTAVVAEVNVVAAAADVTDRTTIRIKPIYANIAPAQYPLLSWC